MISPALLGEVSASVSRDPSVAALRLAFPDLHFTACSEDDVSPRYKSVATLDAFALYFITGASGHCLELTNDAAMATGILIASQADDD